MIKLNYKIILLFALFALSASQQNSSINLSNCSNPIFGVDAFKLRNQTRPRYLNVPAISELETCKVFSNKSSCCSSQTDSDIKALFQKYKEVLSYLTSRKLRAIKQGFEDYSNVNFSSFSNGEEAKVKVAAVVQGIKDRLNQTTKAAVTCARHALKASAGLLCSGCNPNWGRFVKNGRLVLSKNSCLALSNACYGLLKDFGTLQRDAKADITNLTDAITEFIGESTPPGSNDFSLDIPQSRLLASAPIIGFDKTAFCKKWIDSGVALSCEACFIDDFGVKGFTKTFAEWEAKAGCMENPIFKTIIDTDKKYNDPDDVPSFRVFNSLYWMEIIWTATGYQLIPAVIKLKEGNIVIPFISGNETNNDNWINLMKSKASTQLKTARIEESLKDFYILIEAAFYLVDRGVDIEPKEKYISKFDKSYYECLVKAMSFIREEKKEFIAKEKEKKDRDISFIVMLAENNDPGLTYDEEYDGENPMRSGVPEFLKKCSNSPWNSKVNRAKFLIKKYNFTVVCSYLTESDDKVCFLVDAPMNKITPPVRSKNEAALGFDKVKASGADPQRKSLGTLRIVPFQIVLPKEVNKVAESQFTAPCDNVTHCASWFCNTFLNIPFARVEKLFNPQNASDELDSEASNAYNYELKRVLQEKTENEVSDEGFNFFAVAENSFFNTSVTIDGVTEEAPGYDVNLKSNTTLNPNDFLPVNLTQGNSTNNTGNGTNRGNGLVGKIKNTFVILTFVLLFLSLV